MTLKNRIAALERSAPMLTDEQVIYWSRRFGIENGLPPGVTAEEAAEVLSEAVSRGDLDHFGRWITSKRGTK
jgi:hypothetical protein